MDSFDEEVSPFSTLAAEEEAEAGCLQRYSDVADVGDFDLQNAADALDACELEETLESIPMLSPGRKGLYPVCFEDGDMYDAFGAKWGSDGRFLEELLQQKEGAELKDKWQETKGYSLYGGYFVERAFAAARMLHPENTYIEPEWLHVIIAKRKVKELSPVKSKGKENQVSPSKSDGNKNLLSSPACKRLRI
jgi:hypothetical protein